MSAPEHADGPPQRGRVADTVAGYLAATAIFAGLTALVYFPARLGPAAIFIALLSAGMGGGIRRFTALAMAVATGGFFFGMVIAVVLDRPIF